MKLRFLILLQLSFLSMDTILAQSTDQHNFPYKQIDQKPESFTAATVLARMIDGLGYRYYWATEDLTDDDLVFRPSEDASNVIETLTHIQSLAEVVLNAVMNRPNVNDGSPTEFSFFELRSMTLQNLKQASDYLVSNPDLDLATLNITFLRGENTSSYDLWHLMNGPLADAIYHTGQLVSFRRTNENPIHPKVNVFTGKNRN